jgi:hypothetical protein
MSVPRADLLPQLVPLVNELFHAVHVGKAGWMDELGDASPPVVEEADPRPSLPVLPFRLDLDHGWIVSSGERLFTYDASHHDGNDTGCQGPFRSSAASAPERRKRPTDSRSP